MDDLLSKPFEPCVIVYELPKRTEMVLRDTAMFWHPLEPFSAGVELGYDMETRELVAVRIFGDVAKR